ncbi:uncharacterized protein [Montipora capricornis]|uniref:uncharacterized protein n=1 Tax=Montipora capricornis TaxID=246305 RepID=UPI0035F1EA54
MNTQKTNGRKVIQEIALVVQVLIVLKGVDAATIMTSPSIVISSPSATSSPYTTSAPAESSSATPTTASQGSLATTVATGPSLTGSAAFQTSLSTSSATPTTASQGSLATTVATGQSLTGSAAFQTSLSTSSATPTTASQGSLATTVATGQSLTGSAAFQTSLSTSSFTPAPIQIGSSSTIYTTFQPSASTTSDAPSSSISSNTSASENETVEPVFVQISFSMVWGRLCYLTSFFTDSLSRDLLVEAENGTWDYLSTEKIKLINRQEMCHNRSRFGQKAVLKFYISYSAQGYGQNDTDNITTEEAYNLLDKYWRDNRMVLLDQIFERKVTKVEHCTGFVGETVKCKVDEEYTEAQRIWIGIGIGLAVIVLILLIIQIVKCRLGTKKHHVKLEDNNMAFTNSPTLEEGIPQDHTFDEPEAIEIHRIPQETREPKAVTKEQGEMPLLSAISDYEDGKKATEKKSEKEVADKVPEDEPVKQPENTGSDLKDEGPEEPTIPEGRGSQESSPTFTSSMNIVLTPDATDTPSKFEFPSQDDDEGAKHDFGQSQSSDGDPKQGAINLAFDLLAEGDSNTKNPEEETKF